MVRTWRGIGSGSAVAVVWGVVALDADNPGCVVGLVAAVVFVFAVVSSTAVVASERGDVDAADDGSSEGGGGLVETCLVSRCILILLSAAVLFTT